MDTDDEHLLVQEAGAALAKSNEVGHLQNGGEQMAGRKMCQPERKLSFTRPCWMPVVLFFAVILMWAGSNGKQPTNLPFSFSPCLHLETGGGVLARHRCGFRRVELAEHHSGVNSIDK